MEKRVRPYDVGELPFGESWKNLKLDNDEEGCKCPIATSFADISHSRQPLLKHKLIKDAKLKLHHQVKDHKIVVRAAKLRLHQSRNKWYRSAAPHQGTVQRQDIFGATAQSNDFHSVARSAPPLASDQSYPPTPTFINHRTLNSAGSREFAHNQLHGNDVRNGSSRAASTCAEEARNDATDLSVDELASYFDEFVHIPRKMSEMAEMMYT